MSLPDETVAAPVAERREDTVDGRRGTLRGRPRAVVRRLLLLVIRPFMDLTIEGLENVPASGPLLFVANHVHNADPILLEMAITRPVHFMAKQELFRNPVLAWLLRRAGAFPVDRGRPDRAAIRRAEALLAQGIAVGMFPEGTRSKSGRLQPAFPGAGLIAVRSGALILPAAIVGTENPSLHQAGARPGAGAGDPAQRRRRVAIRFGEPFSLPAGSSGTRFSATQATELIMTEIARLLPVTHRGVYAAHVATPELAQVFGEGRTTRSD